MPLHSTRPQPGVSGLGHVASTIIFCILIFAVTVLVIRWIGPKTRREAVFLGMIWLIATILFEFFAGHFLFGNTWAKLFADYNIVRGRIWIFVLCVTYLSPVLAARVRRLC